MGAEISLAAYEALVSILKVFVSTFFPHSLYLVEESEQMFSETEGRSQLDYMCLSFIQNINDLLGSGVLARSRRAVLLDIKVPFFLFCHKADIFVAIYLIFGLYNWILKFYIHLLFCYSSLKFSEFIICAWHIN